MFVKLKSCSILMCSVVLSLLAGCNYELSGVVNTTNDNLEVQLKEAVSGEMLTAAGGSFTFDYEYASGAAYYVQVVSPKDVCKVENGQGVFLNGDVGDVVINCEGGAQACTKERIPVCGTVDGIDKTFSNKCLAELAGADPIKLGPCDNDVVCLDIYEPVCGVTAGQELVTYPNACMAEAAGAEVKKEGSCIEGCGAVYLPVCGKIFDVHKTYSSECAASAAGAMVEYEGECKLQQACDQDYQPVCAISGNKLKTFSNNCEALADDAEVIYKTKCGELNCLAVYDPVCGKGLDGKLATYSNSCHALAVGASEISKGACDSNLANSSL